MFNFGATEILVILAVALIFLGPKKLPQVARQVGKGLAELRRATNDIRQTIDEELKDVKDDLPNRKEIEDSLLKEADAEREKAEKWRRARLAEEAARKAAEADAADRPVERDPAQPDLKEAPAGDEAIAQTDEKDRRDDG